MTRKLTIVFLLAVLAAALAVSTGVVFAETAPFQPGDALFPVQHYAEQQTRFYHNAQQEIAWSLLITERRISDLAAQAGSANQHIALQYLDQAVMTIAEMFSYAPAETMNFFNAQLTATLKQAKIVVSGLGEISEEDANYTTSVEAKISTFLMLIANEDLVSLNSAPHFNSPLYDSSAVVQIEQDYRLNTPLIIRFYEGSGGWEHAFYPLIGVHATIDCSTCHMEGNYQGTPRACQDCHQDVQPDDHYAGDCAACHNPADWLDVYFDHIAASATDCKLCHTDEKPVDHYSGQCSACHSTNAWKPANFNHSGFNNCADCHSAPPHHYSGSQCSACHSTNAWIPANFNHSGFSNCQACHIQPANHYGGQCSQCHNTNAWRPANFNHSGFSDCKACHDRPSNHYGGQCSQCHGTNNWDFNHSGQSNCRACHSGHEDEQCSNCHNTSNWDDADDDDGGGEDPEDPEDPVGGG